MNYSFILKTNQIIPVFRFQLLHQTNPIILKPFTHKNAELKKEYRELRHLILESLEEDNKE